MRPPRTPLALALLAALAPACPRRAPPAPRDAAPPREPDPRPRAEPPVAPPATPALPPDALGAEPPRAFAPGAPPGCEIVPPVRQLALPPGAPTAFATAVTTRFALLAVSVGPTASTAADALVVTLTRDAPAPALSRGPLEPGALALVAGGTAERALLVWVRPESDAATPARVRFAWLPADPSLAVVRTLDRRVDARVSDAACGTAACTLAWGFADPGAAPDSPGRAAFTLMRPDAPDAPAPTRLLPSGVEPANALPPDAPAYRGTVQRGARVELVPTRDELPPEPLPAVPLDLARVADATYALTASAPTVDACQPGAWRAELARVSPARALTEPELVGVTDARPRGARIRSAAGAPLVTWLDAPQCSSHFFVIRARRNGATATIATAEDYDVAVAGEDVSLALREGDRLRWVRYRCPAAPATR